MVTLTVTLIHCDWDTVTPNTLLRSWSCLDVVTCRPDKSRPRNGCPAASCLADCRPCSSRHLTTLQSLEVSGHWVPLLSLREGESRLVCQSSPTERSCRVRDNKILCYCHIASNIILSLAWQLKFHKFLVHPISSFTKMRIRYKVIYE